jgi:predicted secreted protein
MLRATILATVLFALYYVNYVQGWLTLEMLPGYRGGQ